MKLPLDKIVQTLEEEARMVLPGIQAFLGFQLVAVFSARFADLDASLQELHLVATLSTAIAMLLVLTPAAYHRQAEPDEITEEFCRLGSRLLTLSLVPLALGSSLDLYVISSVILRDHGASLAIAVGAGLAFFAFWFAFPRWKRHSRPSF